MRKASPSNGSCDLHEQRGTLNVDKKDLGRLMCPACDLRGRWRKCRCIAWKGGFTEKISLKLCVGIQEKLYFIRV